MSPFHISSQPRLSSKQTAFYQEEEGDRRIHIYLRRDGPVQTRASYEHVYPHPSSIHCSYKEKNCINGRDCAMHVSKEDNKY